MPVEITLPLTKLEQAVADARSTEQVMAAKVEEAKLVLKSAKVAWEESVGALMLAVDDMIRDKRQPSIPFEDFGSGDSDTGAGAPAGPDPAPPAPGGAPVETVIEILPRQAPPEGFAPGAPDVQPIALVGGPSWRSFLVLDQIEAPEAVSNALTVFGVRTLGELADALVSGRTFNLNPEQVAELQEVIEQVSADDAEPIRFERAAERPEISAAAAPAITITAVGPADAVEMDLVGPAEQGPEAEPARAPKKPRGRKAKVEQADFQDL